jgi:sialate O-acetylesterase
MKRLFLLSVLFVLTIDLFGKVRLPNIFSSDMVLQQNSIVKIWGWANPNEKITLKTDWLKSPVTTAANENGRWLIKFPTIKGGGPHTITISGENEIVLNNVLLGEVWICSGQSNMEFTIKMLGGWDSHYKNDKEDFIKNGYPQLRFCQVEKTASNIPLDTCKARWFSPDLDAVENFSATAFFFGRELYNKLNVPIGLISTNWGGTPAETWTEKEYLEKDSDLNYFLKLNSSWEAGQPGNLYNAMINPLINYTIRGAIWYQGEANVDNSNLYTKLFTTMIKCWRDKWQIGDFPFYYVQIAPYNYGDESESSAYLREAQLKTLSSSKNTGMAVTMDIGNPNNIHPTQKQDVGRRLALWAFAKTYKLNVHAFSGPLFKKYQIEKDKIRLYFDYADKGLYAKGDKLKNFKIADESMNFVDAEAVIEKNTVVVFNQSIKKPVAARFAFTNTDSSNLFNKEGLPASSFRTDTIPFYKPAMSIIKSGSSNNGLSIKLACADNKASIHYTLDGTEPSFQSPEYGSSIVLDKSVILKTRAFNNGIKSLNKLEFTFDKHLAFGKKVIYKEKFSPKYESSGEFALTDGIRGSTDFHDGFWQGFQQINFEAVIDLEEVKTINKISIGFLKAIGSWIFPPKKIEYFISEDGINYSKLNELINGIPSSYGDVVSETFSIDANNSKARYIKIAAENAGVCPGWHTGKGDKAWLFTDEIIVK